MQRLSARLALLIFFPLLCEAREPSEVLVLSHVNVIDVAKLTLHADQTVVIEHGRIAAMAPSDHAKTPKDAHVIDAHGKFLCSGLWDMHVHLAGVSADPTWSGDVLLPLLLAYGITGVRDMGGDLDSLLAWKRGIEAGSLLGPHIVAAGPWLAGRGRKSPEQYPVHNVDEARAAVRDLKQRGADFIKIISLPSKEAFFAVADECKKQNISFVGHLPFQVGAAEASNAGIHSIEHFLYSGFALSFSSKEGELRQRFVTAEEKGDSAAWEQIAHEAESTYNAEKAAVLFQTLKKNGTWVTPTLASLAITSHPEQSDASDPLLTFVPPQLASQWQDSLNDEQVKKRAAWLARQASNDWKLAAELHRAGVPMLVGSDSLDPFVFPGPSLHRELAELVRAGFTPGEALRNATLGATQFLARDKELGTVEPGKIADLVLFDASPLENIANTQKIFAVVRAGKFLDRAALDALLSRAKSAAAAATEAK